MAVNQAEKQQDNVDVVIVGGGICGLTLALQLSQRIPTLSIAVVEKSQHPVKEAAHKVGESTVEMQGHYLRDVLGLGAYLDGAQLHKFGLRMFFSYNGNTDISRRAEYGQSADSPVTSYQLDRGRFENDLGEIIREAGVAFMDGTRVTDVQLRSGTDPHTVTVSDGGPERTLTARWVIDASGRAATLKRQLSLHKPTTHKANASWFRIDYPIDVETWSEDPDWLARVPSGKRRLSTNHLMGEGYWVWIIPLASGSTSIGVVADDNMHPFHKISTFEKTFSFLETHEPQCAAEVGKHSALRQDFRAMKDYAYSCQQVYSNDRWCLTGEAGVAIDPLYSPGGDMMSLSNGFVTDLIERDHRGEDIESLADLHSQLYLLIVDEFFHVYENQLPVMGNARVMATKIVWDTAVYWAVLGLLFFHGQMPRLINSHTLLQGMIRFGEVNSRVEKFFREWAAIDNPCVSDRFANPRAQFDWFADLLHLLPAGLSDEDLELQFSRNISTIEQLSGQLWAIVIDKLSESRDTAVAAQLALWLEDALISELVEKYRAGVYEKAVDDDWPLWNTLPVS